MNFTRDPIIETVITPKEGCKLVVRNSKGAGEEYLVDALEVVSFGSALFFRSKEKPKVFLVPVSDYEVLELKEARMSLKNASHERSIKIGGGKELSKPSKEDSSEVSSSEKPEKKREKQRRRPRRSKDKERTETSQEKDSAESASDENRDLVEKAPSFISKLFPPPTTLIQETISRYKTDDPVEEDILPLVIEDLPYLDETLSSEEPLVEPEKPKEEE